MINKQDKLLDLLADNKLIDQEQLLAVRQSAAFSKRSVEELLLERKAIDPEELAKVKAKVFNLPYQNLSSATIDDRVLNIIPIEAAENYKVICFDKTENKINVGILHPDNFKAIEAVNFLAKKRDTQVEYYLISDLSFGVALKQYKSLKKEVFTALETKAEAEEEQKKTKKQEGIKLEEIIKTAPVAKIVSVIISHAADGRASDIHIEPLQKESRVRYRIDGVLRTSLILPKSIHRTIVGRIKVMANLKFDETRIPQDGRIRLTVNKKEIDLRVSILPLVDDEKVVIRILDVAKGAPGLDELGFSGTSLGVIEKNIKKTDSILLVTGPTGSGKSTTLFSILNKLNKEGINISTLEDPVEYFIKGVNQSQIKPEVGFNFASGLRSLLRQDPDIIMVGEIRDNETAELAIHAGLTGHFVLSTLHTNDAIGAIPRLLDMKIEPFLLGSTLNTVIAQRLTRKICEHCKVETKLPPNVLADIKKKISGIPADLLKEAMPDFDINNLTFYKGKGCNYCGQAGYGGRIAIAEVIDINDKIMEIIMDENSVLKLEDVLKSQKFLTIQQDGIIKILQGLTTVEEILRVAYS